MAATEGSGRGGCVSPRRRGPPRAPGQRGQHEADAAVAALLDAGLDARHDPVDRRVSAAAPAGEEDLARALAALAAAGVAVDEAALRRPTLDDAFFALAVEAPEAVR